MEEQKVYLVYNRDSSSEPPRAVFDSKERAIQYTKRFKRNGLYAIVEQVLNPQFVADPERMPFEIMFEVDGKVHIRRHDSNEEDIALAVKDGYEEDGRLFCYTLAKKESEALAKAMEIKDRAIAKGDWEDDDNTDYQPDLNDESGG